MPIMNNRILDVMTGEIRIEQMEVPDYVEPDIPPPPTPEERITELERQLKETNDKLEAAEILLGVSK